MPFTYCGIGSKPCAPPGRAGQRFFASSVVTRIGVANHEASVATKGGIEALARSAAATYAPLCAAHVAGAMVWFLSDNAARITGQVIAVDGGFTSVRPLVK